MRFLFILSLITYCLLLTIPVYAEEIDTSADTPTFGENIPLGDSVVAEGTPGAVTVKHPPTEVNVGPRDKVKFPDLNDLTNTATRALPFLLPDDQLQKLKLPEANTNLKGVIYNPGCKTQGEKSAEAKGSKEFSAPDYWSKLIGATKLNQAIGVPGNSSDVELSLPNSPSSIPDGNQELPNCPPELAGITSNSSVDTETHGTFTNVKFSWLEKIIEIVKGFLPGQSQVASVIIKPQKFLQGEAAFARQTSEEMGFLRSFCPENLCPKQVDELVNTDYAIGNDTKDIKIAFRGVAGARQGETLLKQSLYPQELQYLVSSGGTTDNGGTTTNTGTGLTYTLPYRDANFIISNETKQRLIQRVLQNWPNSKIFDYWDTVVSRSRSAGVNPAFTMAIWIEESAAGGAIPVTGGYSEFGCFPNGDTSQRVPFDKSLNCFINFTSIEHPNDFTEWMKYFCGPQVQPICANNPNFVNNLKNWYDEVSR